MPGLSSGESEETCARCSLGTRVSALSGDQRELGSRAGHMSVSRGPDTSLVTGQCGAGAWPVPSGHGER